jgi:hypothetical protein
MSEAGSQHLPCVNQLRVGATGHACSAWGDERASCSGRRLVQSQHYVAAVTTGSAVAGHPAISICVRSVAVTRWTRLVALHYQLVRSDAAKSTDVSDELSTPLGSREKQLASWRKHGTSLLTFRTNCRHLWVQEKSNLLLGACFIRFIIKIIIIIIIIVVVVVLAGLESKAYDR